MQLHHPAGTDRSQQSPGCSVPDLRGPRAALGAPVVPGAPVLPMGTQRHRGEALGSPSQPFPPQLPAPHRSARGSRGPLESTTLKGKRPQERLRGGVPEEERGGHKAPGAPLTGSTLPGSPLSPFKPSTCMRRTTWGWKEGLQGSRVCGGGAHPHPRWYPGSRDHPLIPVSGAKALPDPGIPGVEALIARAASAVLLQLLTSILWDRGDAGMQRRGDPPPPLRCYHGGAQGDADGGGGGRLEAGCWRPGAEDIRIGPLLG